MGSKNAINDNEMKAVNGGALVFNEGVKPDHDNHGTIIYLCNQCPSTMQYTGYSELKKHQIITGHVGYQRKDTLLGI